MQIMDAPSPNCWIWGLVGHPEVTLSAFLTQLSHLLILGELSNFIVISLLSVIWKRRNIGKINGSLAF